MQKSHIGIALLTLLAFAIPAQIQAKNLVGKNAPNFTLEDQDGKKHSLADYRGQVVVLEWTNPKCPFVVRHYDRGTMKNLANKNKKDGVVWLAINSSHYTSSKETTDWAKKYGHDFPTLQDPSGKVGQAYGAKTTPHMYVVGKKGTVLYEGAIDSDPWVEDPKATNFITQALADLKSQRAVRKKYHKPYGCSVKYKK